MVGYYYPVLMFFLLAIFPLARLVPPADAAPGLLVRFWTGRTRLATYLVAAAFSALQLVPRAFPGDTAITGEGRVYALHMFDARVVCDAHAAVRHLDGRVSDLDLELSRAVRINCDPIVVFNRARNLCLGRGRVGDVADLHLVLRVRRTTDPALRPVVDVANFCSTPLHYNPFWHNRWIATD